MKWTEDEARRFFSDSPSWAGRRSSNWEAAQALIAALDQERADHADTVLRLENAIAHMVGYEKMLRARVAKLERVAEAARGLTPPCDYESDYDSCAPSCAICPKSELCAALAALETPDE